MDGFTCLTDQLGAPIKHRTAMLYFWNFGFFVYSLISVCTLLQLPSPDKDLVLLLHLQQLLVLKKAALIPEQIFIVFKINLLRKFPGQICEILEYLALKSSQNSSNYLGHIMHLFDVEIEIIIIFFNIPVLLTILSLGEGGANYSTKLHRLIKKIPGRMGMCMQNL